MKPNKIDLAAVATSLAELASQLEIAAKGLRQLAVLLDLAKDSHGR